MLTIGTRTPTGIGCLLPFLSSHQKDMGLTTFESGFLNCLTAVAALVAAPISGLVAHKLDKYQTLLVLTLLGSGLAFTSLLFVPRVLRSPRHPHLVFDCTNSQLRMESCANWDGNCNLRPRMPAIGNYSNFALTKCKYVCPSNSLSGSDSQSMTTLADSLMPGTRSEEAMNASWYPLHVCFSSASEGSTCLLHDPTLADKGQGFAWTLIHSSPAPSSVPAAPSAPGLASTSATASVKANSNSQQQGNFLEPSKLDTVHFDSRFDRWPVVSLSGEPVCVFQALAPLILNHRSYDTIQCRPFVQSCQVHCKVNLLHRPKGGSGRSKPPSPCLDVTGDPMLTFYAYLVLRSFADLFLFVAYNLLDGLAISLTNNFDTLYTGSARFFSLIMPLTAFPLLTGSLLDYYSQQAGQPDYAPAFILFDGLILITAVLVVAAPAAPLASSPAAAAARSCSASVPPAASSSSTRAAAKQLRKQQRLLQQQQQQPASASGSQSQSSLRPNASHRLLLKRQASGGRTVVINTGGGGHGASVSAGQHRSQGRVPVRNWYILALVVVPLTLWSGLQVAILQTHLFPFLMSLGVSQSWLGGCFAIAFLAFLPFCLMGKRVVSGIGRLHLVLLSLLFHGLHMLSVSLLVQPHWLLLPVQAMVAFTLPLAWIGLTSYAHHLIRWTPCAANGDLTATKTRRTQHLRLQYLLNGLHFGVGRVLGCGLWLAWIVAWDAGAGIVRSWLWPGFLMQEALPELPEPDEDGFRVLLRLLAFVSLVVLALPILFFGHVLRHILDCFAGVASEIKKSIVCVQGACFKCFSLLCCCSCSCQFGQCRLCRRRRRHGAAHGSSGDSFTEQQVQDDGDDMRTASPQPPLPSAMAQQQQRRTESKVRIMGQNGCINAARDEDEGVVVRLLTMK